MNLRLLPTAAVALICALASLALVGSAPGAIAAPDTRVGVPDNAVLTVEPEQGMVALSSVGFTYLSPVTAASGPFTHMLLRWEASGPVSGTLTLQVRASLDGQSWTEWGNVPENPDLWVPEDGPELFWSQEIYAGEGARFWQVRAAIGMDEAGRRPNLRRIQVSTVDARFGPASPQATPEVTARALNAGLSRPPVVSRTAWGSPDGQGSRVRPVYYPVKHMVVHHTADANSLTGREQSWSDRVRAIWAFHTNTRGWGDIGYNYLVAPDGTIYEGRAGGDDAVAFHDTANYGSMGVSLIGTYSEVGISAAASDSLARLLAWKAAQKGIDPLGRSFYYGCYISNSCRPYNPGSVVENISGHRQVTPGRTSCPGDRLLGSLPALRNRVKAMVDAARQPSLPDNGDLQVDEAESSFSRTEALWYGVACGYGGGATYTYATDNPAESTNAGTWRPNIPAEGSYRLFAAIPRGCGLGQPATERARYQITHADGVSTVVVNQNSAEEWVDLGVYRFAAGTGGFVRLDDLTGEAYSQRRVIFFDSIRWVPEQQARVELVNVSYGRTTVAAGELLTVTFTVRNTGEATALSQGPEAGRRPDGSFDPANGYVYDEGECFLGAEGQSYPIFAKEAGRFRLALGASDPSAPAVTCGGGTGGYPWRWGLDGPLAPGQTRTVTGYVRFRTPGTFTVRAALVQEYVRYQAEAVAPTTITVTPEALAPAAVAYDEALRPVASVYRLAAVPDNLLARTLNPLSVVKGEYLGSFAWGGGTLDWGEGGPVVTRTVEGAFGTTVQTAQPTDGFIIEQTRVFIAPEAGLYTFRAVSDDGSWLWVNGQPVIVNAGLHGSREVTGTIQLPAGRHVLAFKAFERTGAAAAGYAVQLPGRCGFSQPPDGLSGAAPAGIDERYGAALPAVGGLTIAADDLGGSGVSRLRYSWDGQTWFEEEGRVLTVGRLAPGSYQMRYQAVDGAGNRSAVQQLRLTVDPSVVRARLYFPLLGGGEASCRP